MDAATISQCLAAGQATPPLSHQYPRTQSQSIAEAHLGMLDFTAAGPVMKVKVGLLASALALLGATSAAASDCPAVLKSALRLVLITAPSMSTPRAQVQLFERPTVQAPWKPASSIEPGEIGKAGMGWGNEFGHLRRNGEPEKYEGDRKSPAGVFSMGASFGFDDVPLRRHIVVRAGETVCVEDPSSVYYNQITTRSKIERHVKPDEMRRTPLFRRGLFVAYPTDRLRRRGSCIFVHIWSPTRDGTAGCIGLPESRVAELQKFSEPGAVLAVLPEAALSRMGNCLPSLVRSEGR